ncbi:MAG: OmpA family protein, partial [Saprospiraceae bacterium]|nr:OmpA family protein [Saprospiraceae bacterium]
MPLRIWTLLILIVPGFLTGQNLVPNPGFEACDFQPVHLSSDGRTFERASRAWTVPNEASTDLISPRFRSSNLTPIPPHSGRNMAGVVINGDFWAEYVGVKLKQPVKAGTTYYVEWWMSMPTYYSRQKPVPTFLNDHFGVLISEHLYQYDKRILLGKPQVEANNEILIEPAKWTKVSGSFVADQDAEYLYLGQFFDKEDKSKIARGYFLFDDVFIEAFSSEAVQYTPSRYYKIENGVAAIKMDNIYFQTDKHELVPESHVELDKLVSILEKNPTIRIEIQGHTDDEGNENYNFGLSERRAQSVFKYLVEKGIPEERLTSKGFGLSNPVTENSDEAGKQANRRVEFVIRGDNQDTRNVLDPEQIYRFADEVNPLIHEELSISGKDDRYWDCSEKVEHDPTEQNAEKRLEKYKPASA